MTGTVTYINIFWILRSPRYIHSTIRFKITQSYNRISTISTKTTTSSTCLYLLYAKTAGFRQIRAVAASVPELVSTHTISITLLCPWSMGIWRCHAVADGLTVLQDHAHITRYGLCRPFLDFLHPCRTLRVRSRTMPPEARPVEMRLRNSLLETMSPLEPSEGARHQPLRMD